jgi:MFS family permease
MMTVFPLQMITVLPTATAGDIGTLFAAAALVGFVGAPIGGLLADRIGRKNTVVPAACLISLGAVLTASLGTGSVLDYSTYVAGEDSLSMLSYSTILPPVLLWGLGNSLTNPGLSAFAADIADDEETRGQALALSRMAGRLACSVQRSDVDALLSLFPLLCLLMLCIHLRICVACCTDFLYPVLFVVSGDAAFLLAPAGLGLLAQFTSCATALHVTAVVVMSANLAFIVRATERQKEERA